MATNEQTTQKECLGLKTLWDIMKKMSKYNKKYKKTLQIVKGLDKEEREALNDYILDQKITTRVDLVYFIEREF